MFVCELKLCDFVVWTEKGLSVVVPVAYNEEFVLSMCQKVECFWLNHVLPLMVNEITEMNYKDNINIVVLGRDVLGWWVCLVTFIL